jgi:hypothetical protein
MRTIVQVLIVVLFLVLAGGLLVAAVSRVRDAAARMSCNNNLSQVGKACHMYTDSNNRFPWAAEPNPDLPPERRLSWLLSIQPYVEAGNLYARTDRTKGWDAPENRFLALTVYRTYQCPGIRDQQPVSTLVPTHYVGIAGLGDDAASLPQKHPRAGLFAYDRKLSIEDVKDHTSTLLLAV